LSCRSFFDVAGKSMEPTIKRDLKKARTLQILNVIKS